MYTYVYCTCLSGQYFETSTTPRANLIFVFLCISFPISIFYTSTSLTEYLDSLDDNKYIQHTGSDPSSGATTGSTLTMLFLTSFFSLSLFLTSVVYLPVGTSTSSTTSSSSSSYDWTPVLAVIDDAITNQVFPGAVAAVRDATGELIFTAARGSFTYGVPPPYSNGTVPKDTVNESYFDMASCSKIIGPTTTAAYLWQEVCIRTRIR